MIPAYIIHASTYHARKAHMLKQIERKNMDAVFILDGDKQSINEIVVEKYFKGQPSVTNGMSCSYKHFLAYEKIISTNQEWALILEDDVFLHDCFNNELDLIKQELKLRSIKNALISLEDSSLTFIERSKRIKGQRLYAKSSGRMAGAYLIDQAGAKSILREVEAKSCFLPIDWFHNHCVSAGVLNIYWTIHAIATQGSLSGRISSTIDKKPANPWRYLSFMIQRKYKKMLYWLR
jgi:GR25 family glycosyltransferase involved in LPS biosynthesis